MDMIKIVCLGVTGVILAKYLNSVNAPFAHLVSMASCILIIYYSAVKISSILEVLNDLERDMQIQGSYYRILLKIAGISFLADFSADLCKDAGFSAVAGQIELFGKISVLTISSPLLLSLIETVYSFL